MSYSIVPIIHPRPDKRGLHKIQIRIIQDRKKSYEKTEFKVKQNQFDVWVINHPTARFINDKLKKQIEAIEQRLIIGWKEMPTVQNFILSIKDLYKGKLSEGSVKHYHSIANKIKPDLSFTDISVKWMEDFEAALRKTDLQGNSINANMKRLKSVFSKAKKEGYILENQFKDYKVPRYEQKLVAYLTEDEIQSVHSLVAALGKGGMKTGGYYFLLSCYAGYRLSDAKKFDYSAMVHKDKIILRTAKNKAIVSIPVHSRLKKVLEFVKDNPLKLSEHHIRKYVKEVVSLAGIKKKVNYHTSRHSFAMLLMANGFTKDDVAELIGDSELIAKVYAKVHSPSLHKKIMDKLG